MRKFKLLIAGCLGFLACFESPAFSESRKEQIRCRSPLTADECEVFMQEASLSGEYVQRFRLVDERKIPENDSRETLRGRVQITFQESHPGSKRQLLSLLYSKRDNVWVRDKEFLWGDTLVFDLSFEDAESLVDFIDTESTLLNEFSLAEIHTVPKDQQNASNNTIEFDLLLTPDDIANKKLSNKHVAVFKRDDEYSLE